MPTVTTVVLLKVKWDESQPPTWIETLYLPVGSDCYELSLFGITQRKSKAKSKAKSKVLAR